jgi:hypothetical protein
VIGEDWTLDRTQRTVVLGAVADLSRREARSLLQKRVSEINQGRYRARPMMTFEKFATTVKEVRGGQRTAPQVKSSSVTSSLSGRP